jgi:hypothetical protein
MRPEYDFSQGVRGKHAAKYAEGTNVVVLEPDVAREFKTAEQVNETLRAVSKLLQQECAESRKVSQKFRTSTLPAHPVSWSETDSPAIRAAGRSIPFQPLFFGHFAASEVAISRLGYSREF